jgi:hypothetical protein|tara:strand:+ start:1866 stop:2045 length:180 start_codon:yes stop_codon:yes gene_type:complete
MYKIKLKKDIEFRGVEYIKGETYNVGRKERNFFFQNEAIAKPTKKKSKTEGETSKDLDD